MWGPQRLTTLWAFTACYRGNVILRISWTFSGKAQVSRASILTLMKSLDTSQWGIHMAELTPELIATMCRDSIELELYEL
jgi:hypothetical protein